MIENGFIDALSQTVMNELLSLELLKSMTHNLKDDWFPVNKGTEFTRF